MINKIKNIIIDFLPTVIIGCLLAFVLNTFVGVTVVKGSSMEPTLFTNDTLIINKIAKLTNDIDRGDIVVFDATPGEKLKDKVFYIKRVIGKEGDFVEIKNGDVYVNNKKIDENYADKTDSFSNISITIPKDSYFVLGDNRDVSNDSRYFGTITHQQLSGKISLRLFPDFTFSIFK